MDEPDLKATFSVRLGHLESMTAKANMPIVETINPVDNLPGYIMDVR